MKKLSVLFGAVMMVVSVGMAKAQKIATLDLVSVLNAMPEKKKADTDLKAFLDAKESEKLVNSRLENLFPVSLFSSIFYFIIKWSN